MNNNIHLNQFHESEIRPQEAFDQWKIRLAEELKRFFSDENQMVAVNCVGCGSAKCDLLFVKLGFKFYRCRDCRSVYVSPRPTAESLDNFYKNSESMMFWRDKIVRATMDTGRRQQVYARYMWFLDLMNYHIPEAKNAVDYKPKYMSLFSVEPEFTKKFRGITLVNPLHLINEGTENLKIIGSIDSLSEPVDVITAFEVLDREYDPRALINKISSSCRQGGLFLFTTNTISGFEYQILGKESPRLVVPDRMNLLSVEAIRQALIDAQFDIIELSTPGKLDVEIVLNEYKRNSNLDLPDFIKYILNNRDSESLKTLQDFLQLNNLSSYLRGAAIKK